MAKQARTLVLPNSVDRLSPGNRYALHQTSASWLVLFIRQANPAASYSKGTEEELSWKPPMIIENDCFNVQYQGTKASYGKTCRLELKAQEVYYLGAVSPGDWVVVWLANDQQHIDRIRLAIGSGKKSDMALLNDWHSGLKFVGRVGRVNDSVVVQQGGVKTVTQSVDCQSFLEMANSIYFTTGTRAILSRLNGTIDPTTGEKKAGKDEQDERDILLRKPIEQALGKNNYDKFKQFFPDSESGRTPDTLIAQIFTSLMGIDNSFLQGKLAGKTDVQPSFGSGIRVPSLLSQIIGTGKEKFLWELYNVYTGVQQYGNRNEANTPVWKAMAPKTETFGFTDNPEKKVFFDSKTPCKGVILYYPALWENRDLWSFMQTYLFDTLNEMYTVLRCNEFNQIKPSLIVREKPFGTGLYNNLKNGVALPVETVTGRPIQKDVEASRVISKEFADRRLVRAQYHSHPRWAIDSSLVTNINVSTDESMRVNFIQIYSNSYLLNRIYPRVDQGDLRAIQFAAGNYVVDEVDLMRNGLRALTVETPFIDFTEGELSTVDWCRIYADHRFNGHLKLRGTITMRGVQLPICEGDNVQVAFKYKVDSQSGKPEPDYNTGFVFHIEGVTHQASISPDGKKTFTTTLSVSNGLLAGSLSKDTDLPRYAHNIGSSRVQWDRFMEFLPGMTDIQKNIHKNRDTESGEIIKSRKQDE